MASGLPPNNFQVRAMAQPAPLYRKKTIVMSSWITDRVQRADPSYTRGQSYTVKRVKLTTKKTELGLGPQIAAHQRSQNKTSAIRPPNALRKGNKTKMELFKDKAKLRIKLLKLRQENARLETALADANRGFQEEKQALKWKLLVEKTKSARVMLGRRMNSNTSTAG